MSNPKVDLRKDFLIKRETMDDVSRKRASSLIRQKLFQQEFWKQANNILCYASFRSEVDTHALIQEAVRFKKRILIPVFDFAHPDLIQVSLLKRYGDLVMNARGMHELRPDAREIVDLKSIDLTLTPGLAFDKHGGRIGFGGGWFDRLFEKAPQTKRVGLAFEVQISDKALPMEPHDLPMHAVVTEKEIIPVV